MIFAGATAASEFTHQVRNDVAADAGSGDRAKWESFRDGKKHDCDVPGSETCLWVVRSCTTDVHDNGS